MGFDLYGINPKIKEGSIKPKRPDWTNCTEEEKEEYFNDLEKFENENKGYYFRNNVWWWRPLAEYVLEHTKVITSKKKIAGFGYNDGVAISATEAEQIAKQLYYLLQSGHTEKYEKEHAEKRALAEKHNEKIKKRLDELALEAEKITGKKDLAPSSYPKELNKKWDEIYNEKEWIENYPFSVNNVKEFADFCKDSGGFTIC
jgi:ribulose bisphosphate carboxylase small subunit